MSLLTDQILASGVTLNDLIHIVITGDTSQNPSGSSFKATIGQVGAAIVGLAGTSGTSGSNGSAGSNGSSGSSGSSGYGAAWGSFISTVDQPIGVAGTTYKMSANTTTGSSNIVLSGGSKFVVTNSGVYNIQFSAQLNKSSGTKSNVFIWLSKNNTPIPQTNTDVTMAGGSGERHVSAWNWVDNANNGDYYEIEWTSTVNNVFLDYDGTPTYGPAIPSLIVTLTQV